MRRLSILATVVPLILVSQAEAITSFYTTDASPNPNPRNLAWFDSVPPASTVTVIGPVYGFEQGDRSTFMDLSSDNRLFVSPMLPTLYELNPETGAVVDSLIVGDAGIEGIAVADTGLIYVSIEDHNSIEVVDWDERTVTPLVGHSFDIDDMDFDADGNLIGHNINSTGEVFRIPLDGSKPQVITTLPWLPAYSMTFSYSDNAFCFLKVADHPDFPGTAQLWRLPWANGQPAGDLEYVKDIYPGACYGLAAIPEPATALLLSVAGSLLALRRRR